MNLKKTKYYKTFYQGVISENPVSKQVLGICSALAVTVQLKPAIVMGFSLTIITGASNMIISLLRKHIPGNIRIIVELTIIATLVIIADQLLKAFLYDISKQLSVFVGLIITNCIVMGRAESFAMGNPPLLSLADGLGNGIGYSLILFIVAFSRELLGAGKLFGISVIPGQFYNAGYENMGIMALAPGAFFVIGLFVWLQNTLKDNNQGN